MNEIPYQPPDGNIPCQGSIYLDISIATGVSPILTQWDFPYAITMSQECDLLQDNKYRQMKEEDSTEEKNEDKLLPTILMCPAYPADSLRKGTHLEKLEIKMERKSTDQYKLVRMNRDPRYHFLAGWPELQVTEMVVDFKHFFTIQTELLRDTYGTAKYYIARLSCPYREHLSQRFTSYLGRIGLPVDHHRIKKGA